VYQIRKLILREGWTMLGIGFFKGQPTEYVIRYVGGRAVKEGRGLSFFYLTHDTQIVAIPGGSIDVDFIFNELTNNFQAVTLQGRLTYRIAEPARLAELLNFTLDERRNYVSDDPELLSPRVVNVVQTEMQREIRARSLEETLMQTEAIAARVLARLKEREAGERGGVELLSIHLLSAKPTPEVSKALEAEYREKLLRKADEAIYARRAAAVEEERTLREKELDTDITLEKQRQQLIELQAGNARAEAESRGVALEKEAEYRTRALEKELAAYRTLDPAAILSLGLKELGQNAGKIGNLTITSEILAALLDGARAKEADQS